MQSLIPFLIIIVVFWLLLILPQQRRQKKVREMQAALAVGDKVMLSSGFLGEVTGIHDDFVEVEVADGVSVKAVRGAIGQTLPPESALVAALEGRAPVEEASSEEGTDDGEDETDREGQDAHDEDAAVNETPEETAKRLGMDKKPGENG